MGDLYHARREVIDRLATAGNSFAIGWRGILDNCPAELRPELLDGLVSRLDRLAGDLVTLHAELLHLNRTVDDDDPPTLGEAPPIDPIGFLGGT